jgi:hypothetical protein
MIEQAHVSGQLGKAIYRDDAGGYFIYSHSSPQPVQCRWGDIQLLLNSGAEFKELGENVQLEEIRDALQLEERRHTALFLCLAGGDEQLTDAMRDRAIDTAEKILQNSTVATFVTNRLLSRPIPDGLLGRDTGDLSKTPVLGGIYEMVLYGQRVIRAVSDIWDEVARAEFESTQEALRVQQFLTDEGFFASVVHCLLPPPRPDFIYALIKTFAPDARLNNIAPRIPVVLDSFWAKLLDCEGTNWKEIAKEREREFTTSESCVTPTEMKLVLVLDDDLPGLGVWVEILSRAPFKCVLTTGSQVSLTGLYEEGWFEKIGIVVTRDNMEFVRELRSIDHTIPTVVIDGGPNAHRKYAGLNIIFLQKPVDPEDLISLVRQALSLPALPRSAQRKTLRA